MLSKRACILVVVAAVWAVGLAPRMARAQMGEPEITIKAKSTAPGALFCGGHFDAGNKSTVTKIDVEYSKLGQGNYHDDVSFVTDPSLDAASGAWSGTKSGLEEGEIYVVRVRIKTLRGGWHQWEATTVTIMTGEGGK